MHQIFDGCDVHRGPSAMVMCQVTSQSSARRARARGPKGLRAAGAVSPGSRDQFSRSATERSMRDALRAGKYDASNVTPSIVSGTSKKTGGSSAPTP